MSNKQQFFYSIANHIWFCSQVHTENNFPNKKLNFLFMTLIIFLDSIRTKQPENLLHIHFFIIRSASFNCFPMIYLVFHDWICYAGLALASVCRSILIFFRLRALFRLRFFANVFFDTSKWIYECDSISQEICI